MTSLATADAPFDPGSGRDASNDPNAPTLLPGFGRYTGEFAAYDTDWYGVDTAAAARCLVIEEKAGIGHHLTLGVKGTHPHSIQTPVPADLQTRLALAAPAVTRTLVGLESSTGTTGLYEFTVQEHTFASLSGVDGGTSSDAPSIPSSTFRVPGPCFKGSVGLKDTADFYAFDVTAGDQVVYSLAATDTSPTMKVLDGAGSVLGSVIGSGGIGVVSVPSTGTYYLAVTVPLESSTSSNYLAGVVGPDPPPGSPCRPHCRVS